MSEFDRRRFLSAIASLTAMAAMPSNLLAFRGEEETVDIEAKIGDLGSGTTGGLKVTFPGRLKKEGGYLVLTIDMKLKKPHALIERFPMSDIEKLLASKDLMTAPFPQALVNLGITQDIVDGFGNTDLPIPFCGKRVDSVIRIGFPITEINHGFTLWYELKVKDIEKAIK